MQAIKDQIEIMKLRVQIVALRAQLFYKRNFPPDDPLTLLKQFLVSYLLMAGIACIYALIHMDEY